MFLLHNLLCDDNDFLCSNWQVKIPVMACAETTLRCDNIYKS